MTATEIVLEHPGDLSDWGRLQLECRPFKAWLRQRDDTIQVGDEWDVFLDVGCCGDTLDLTLRVDSVAGDGGIDEETAIRYVEGPACDVGGWQVQSRVDVHD